MYEHVEDGWGWSARTPFSRSSYFDFIVSPIDAQSNNNNHHHWANKFRGRMTVGESWRMTSFFAAREIWSTVIIKQFPLVDCMESIYTVLFSLFSARCFIYTRISGENG